MLGLLRAAVQPRALVEAVAEVERGREGAGGWSVRERLWLLGNVIFLAGQAKSLAFVVVVSRLLGSLADDVAFEGQPIALDNASFDRDVLSEVETALPLNEYLREQVTSLVDQDAIRNLLSGDSTHAQALSGYALTLLRSFPRRGDEIRMWLHRGPTRESGMPPTHYLWEAAKGTDVFGNVKSNSRMVLSLLKSASPSLQQQQDDWTVILVFLELYGFDLRIMDDEEFMGSGRQNQRNNAVPLADVAQLVTFLKNLGFTLYFHAADLNDSAPLPERDAGSINLGRHFGSTTTPESLEVSESKPLLIAGLPGLTVDYLKGIVTGLLRAIYERDSRRRFLPKDHWLMTDRFDMTAFIPGVVAEEESRHVVQEQEDENEGEENSDEDEEDTDVFTATPIRAAGSNYHARVLRSQQARARAQRKAKKKRYLEAVAPRLEILQNLPFFIPFYTRVQIFRQFVQLDQEKRRNGFVDPDMWRQSMMFQQMNRMASRDPLARHHAQIKRKQEFSDAFDAFYELGADLKEPIQITFVDEFDMPEAGIDGGGVTKEFLTSVITQAFDSDAGHDDDDFFVENERHVLYPNPNAVEDLKLRLRRQGHRDNSPEMRGRVRDLLRRFEFLGRVIGKCLYEGILIDVTFAGFFLKKWPLFGGGAGTSPSSSSGSASLESGYRANINDVRELDEDLYRGLLALKNADDAEQLSLSMSVNNLLLGGGGGTSPPLVVEHDLVPHGSDIPVTNENRLHYISRLTHYRLQGQSAPQTSAFLRGLAAIVLPSWLSMFNQSELQTLIGGYAGDVDDADGDDGGDPSRRAGIDLADLRAHTLYGGTYALGDDGAEHPSVRMFWDVMQGLGGDERRKVLKFVTSTPRGPLLGFAHLNPRFSIRDAGQDEERLPSTSTCVNLLKLPMYRSPERLREKLLMAVNSGAGFDLS